MADISRLSRLLNGVQRGVDLSQNTLVVQSVKIGAGQTELTQAILDKLVTMQSVARADGKYDANDIVVAATATNYTAATPDVEAHLAGIDSALATAGGDEFADDVFRINDNADATKQIAFEASVIATGTLRTITMPDANVNLGDIATNAGNISTNAGNISTNTGNISTNATAISDLQTLSGVTANAQNLGTFTGTVLGDTETIKSAIQSLETYAENSRSIVNNFEWQASAIDYIVDNTLAPPTEVSGDRYVLSHDGGVPNAAYDGASAGDIVEFDGTNWIATTPTVGMFIAVDDEPSVLYQWGGAAWSTKAFESTTASTGLVKVGFDIQLADAAENASGIQVSGGAITLNNLSAFDTDGLSEGVTNLYFTNARARTAAVLNTLTGTETDQAPSVSAVNAALSGKQDASANLDEADTFFGATDLSGAEAETLSDGSNADSLHSHARVVRTFTAGETFEANTTFMVRLALTGEGAGQVYKADYDASSNNNFYAIGFVEGNGRAQVNAAGSVEVVLIGEVSLGSADTNFEVTEVGQPVHLLGSGGFDAVSQITYAVDQASYRGGMVLTTSSILVSNMQLLGIN